MSREAETGRESATWEGSRRAQMRLNASVCRFSLPELYLLTFALLVVTDHELP